MPKKHVITKERILAVEGKDEGEFFKALLQHQKIDTFQVFPMDGKDRFKNELPLLMSTDGFSRVHTLGFIRDAEEKEAGSAFQSICGTLKKSGLPVPKKIDAIIQKAKMRIGVFIMPNNLDEGMLEDLCIASVRITPLFQCLERYLACCSACLPAVEAIKNPSKAMIQAYLACKSPIINSLGVAAQKGYWDFDHACFSDIKGFLRGLAV